ncbi:hypothetical protein F4780DRAFT_794946 [Xylariomycetidae sp. FL0641]|nr:hypothetical protein F4780DRAFT_794946 [Xylariomycetidae sp. FL0641]
MQHPHHLLALALLAAAQPSPSPSGPLGPLTTLLGSLGNAAPPPLVFTSTPSPECAAANGGALQCCRGALAGDQPLVVFLAAVYGYALNPNDVNGVVCDGNLDACPGVQLCCQVTALSPFLSLYCQDYKG